MHIDMNNLNMLKEIIGDDLKSILDVFLDTTPDSILQLQEAVASNTTAKVQSIAHTIKGSSANVGANQLSNLASELEQKAKANDTNAFASLLSKIIAEAQVVEQGLKSYIQTF